MRGCEPWGVMISGGMMPPAPFAPVAVGNVKLNVPIFPTLVPPVGAAVYAAAVAVAAALFESNGVGVMDTGVPPEGAVLVLIRFIT